MAASRSTPERRRCAPATAIPCRAAGKYRSGQHRVNADKLRRLQCQRQQQVTLVVSGDIRLKLPRRQIEQGVPVRQGCYLLSQNKGGQENDQHGVAHSISRRGRATRISGKHPPLPYDKIIHAINEATAPSRKPPTAPRNT
uniref:Uncharacterized protein n=1 Tax=Aplysina aerophoba bacterial symbiont clone pAE27P20 TaxID=377636 RepID=A4U8N9_9BACT|nr:hypothetical protein [Aplysina aerophoba bacterial symbiont clone pAE27P20]